MNNFINYHLVNNGTPTPVCTDNPTSEEINNSNDLIEFIKQNNLNESDEDKKHRQEILANISLMFNSFVKKIALTSHQPKEIIDNARGKLFEFGTYRLGVYIPRANVDVLCAAPNYVTREQFFDDFMNILIDERRIELIDPIPKACVPYIDIMYEKINCHLLFATLPYTVIEEDLDITDEKNLNYADEASVRCINGCRTSETILKLVKNHKDYIVALKFLLEWVSKRNISSNKFGYFGGGSLSNLLCYICELYPNACSFVLVKKFFEVYKQYNWNIPIELMKKIKKNNPLDKFVWDPLANKRDRYHKMILLTPLYPSFNSTPNINEYSLKIMENELKRGYDIIEKIEKGKEKWDKLIEKSDFFYKYNNYLTITISAGNDKDMLKWLGYCESQIRKLVEYLGDTHQFNNIHLHPVGYYNPNISNKNAVYFVGLEMRNKGQMINITIPKIRFNKLIIQNSQCRFRYISLDMKIEVTHCKHIELLSYLELPLSMYEMKRVVEDELYKELETAKRNLKNENEEDEEVRQIRERIKKLKIRE